MTQHRADIIAGAVVTAVAGLLTTGTRVVRGRVYDVEERDLPALSVFMGEDIPLGAKGLQDMGFVDSDLSITIRAHVKSATAQTDSTLSTIRREVYMALVAAGTLSLSYVQWIAAMGASEPLMDGGGEQPIATQDFNYSIRYRAPVSDPGG